MKKMSWFLYVCISAIASTLPAADGTWISSTGGSWTNTDNWASSTPAEGSGSIAYLTTGSGVVTNDAMDLTLLGVELAGSGFTLAGGTLTLDDAGFISVSSGSHTLELPVSLSGDVSLNVASGEILALNGVVSGNGGLLVNGGRVMLSNSANSYSGATTIRTGLVEIASVDALGDSSADPENLVLGDGTLRYTGPSATLARGYTLNPGTNGLLAAVIDVTEADTVLTISGQAEAPNGALIKTGPGTLAYTYPGYQQLSKSRTSVNEASDLVFDADGRAGTNGFAVFTVDEGRVILGAPGQTNDIYAVAWVGSRTLTSPRLDIIGGVTHVYNTYFTIGRGTGTTTSPQQPSVYVSNGALLDLHSFVMGFYNGQPDFYSEPYMHIDNATVIVQNDCFLSENPSLHSTMIVTNNGLFQCDSFTSDRGMSISQSAGADTDINFTGVSTGRTYGLRIGDGGNLNVSEGSVFELDHTPLNVITYDLNKGTAMFNNGILKQRTAVLASDWLTGLDNLLVGSGDMTVNVDGYAMLDAKPLEDPESTGGQVIKTGSGVLSIPPVELDVQVNDGTVAMRHDYPWVTNSLNGNVMLSSGTVLDVLGANTLAAMTVDGADSTLNFLPHSLGCKPEQWKVNSWAKARNDGLLQLADNKGNVNGSLFNYNKVAINQPWTVSFDYKVYSTQSRAADGFAFVLQNDSRGTAAVGQSGGSIGYAGGDSVKIQNSIAVAIDIYNERIRFGKQGAFVQENYFDGSIPYLATLSSKTAFEINYDGSGLLSCTMTVPGYGTYTYEFAVDVAAEVGDAQAYMGFTAGTGGAYGQHMISDLVFDANSYSAEDYCRHGGRLSLGGGETLNATLNPSVNQKGFILGSLNYADQAVIDVNEIQVLPPDATFADQGMWDLNGFASWKPDGGLSVSAPAQNSSGSAYTTNRYPVSSSWVARFNYDMGERSGTPADYIAFCIQDKGSSNNDRPPVPGFVIQWRYYESSWTATQVKMVTNNVTVLGTHDASPVNLVTGGTAEMTVAWDESTRDVTVTTVQAAGTNITVFSNVDVPAVLDKAQDDAYIGFHAYVGGLYSENIVSDFSFASEAMISDGAKGYLAADRLSGSGTLVKRGNADLGLLGHVDESTENVTLQLEEGGLVLKKLCAEVPTTEAARSDWIFTPEGKWAPNGALQFCTMVQNSKGTAMSTRRVRITEPWIATYSFDFGARSSAPADAYSFFFHNDPRGPGITGGQTSGAGYTGISNSIGLRWYFYPNNNTSLEDSTSIGRNGSWDEGSRQSHVPISLVAGSTDFMVIYDPANATLTSIMTQGANVITNIFSGVNIPADVGDDYAYIGFGGGCGGAQAEMRVSDFNLSYTDGGVDDLADRAYLANLILPAGTTNSVSLDTPVANGLFKVSAANLGDGATLTVLPASLEIGTLEIGTVTLDGDAVFDVQASAALALSNTVSGVSITKCGGGVLTLTDVAAYTGDTLLEEGTLALPAANLPETTALSVDSSATLSLLFDGTQYVDTLTVDGIEQPGGAYTSSNTSWVDGTGRLLVRNPAQGLFIILR